MSNLSQWSKDVKKALVDKNMTMKNLAEQIGCSTATMSAVVNGRYANATASEYAKKVNEVLGTSGQPERTDTASDEWCMAVKVKMLEKHMTVAELAKETGVSRDNVSLVINGKQWNDETIAKIVQTLGVEKPVMPSSC